MIRRRDMRRLVAIVVIAVALESGIAAASVAEPEGFRLGDYRAPVPDTVAGGHVIHTDDLKRMIDTGGLILVDVLSAPRKPANSRPDQPWMPVPRRDLPGSLWLPDLGQGSLDSWRDAWFQGRLAAATGGNKNTVMVFYCLSNCWLSWNATKRAIGYGYGKAIWYPEGTDGWDAAGFALAEAMPEPIEAPPLSTWNPADNGEK